MTIASVYPDAARDGDGAGGLGGTASQDGESSHKHPPQQQKQKRKKDGEEEEPAEDSPEVRPGVPRPKYRLGPGFATSFLRPEVQMAMTEMTIAASQVKEMLGNVKVTDMVAIWLAPHYAQMMHEQLDQAEGEERMKLLRTFVQDWAVLRGGDQMAERLLIERERLIMMGLDHERRYKHKTVVGLNALGAWVEGHPEAQDAFDFISSLVRPSGDPERKPMKPWKRPENAPPRRARQARRAKR